MRHYLLNDIVPSQYRPPTPRGRWGSWAGLVIFLVYGLCLGLAQTANENQVKAAYLYNFAKSADWPEQSLPNGPAALVIGVVVDQDDEFLAVMTRLVNGRTVKGHSVIVKRVSTDEELKSCHLIFVRSSAGHKRAQAVVAALAGASVLLVGEDDGFLGQGGMIDLMLAHGTIHFAVEQASLERAHVSLSPELLALAIAETGSSDNPDGESRRLKISTPPEYPEIARRMNIKGTVQLELTVGRDGTVKGVRVIGGHPLLTEALVKAVRGWQFESAAKESHVPVRFVFGP